MSPIARQLVEMGMDATTAQLVAASAQMAALLVRMAEQQEASSGGLAGAGETPGEESTGHGRGREHGG